MALLAARKTLLTPLTLGQRSCRSPRGVRAPGDLVKLEFVFDNRQQTTSWSGASHFQRFRKCGKWIAPRPIFALPHAESGIFFCFCWCEMAQKLAGRSEKKRMAVTSLSAPSVALSVKRRARRTYAKCASKSPGPAFAFGSPIPVTRPKGLMKLSKNRSLVFFFGVTRASPKFQGPWPESQAPRTHSVERTVHVDTWSGARACGLVKKPEIVPGPSFRHFHER